jgi:hypothetical protein
MKKILFPLMAFVATAAVIAAENQPATGFDIDNNGTLSMEEAKAVPGLSEQWEALDVNQDGQLDAAEFSKFVAVETKPAN